MHSGLMVPGPTRTPVLTEVHDQDYLHSTQCLVCATLWVVVPCSSHQVHTPSVLVSSACVCGTVMKRLWRALDKANKKLIIGGCVVDLPTLKTVYDQCAKEERIAVLGLRASDLRVPMLNKMDPDPAQRLSRMVRRG